jgi:hydroxymethylpyrimidine pyrophosphatase-like HAD family hydrolase
MKPSKKVYVFDMDDTLVHCNPETDKANLYLILDVEHELPLLSYFKELRNAGELVYICTTRHPDVKAQIGSYFAIPRDHIICRDFALSTKEMLDIVNSKAKTAEFLAQMVTYKTQVLAKFAALALEVDFFDDCYAQFAIADPNVRVMPPELPTPVA